MTDATRFNGNGEQTTQVVRFNAPTRLDFHVPLCQLTQQLLAISTSGSEGSRGSVGRTKRWQYENDVFAELTHLSSGQDAPREFLIAVVKFMGTFGGAEDLNCVSSIARRFETDPELVSECLDAIRRIGGKRACELLNMLSNVLSSVNAKRAARTALDRLMAGGLPVDLALGSEAAERSNLAFSTAARSGELSVGVEANERLRTQNPSGLNAVNGILESMGCEIIL